MILVIEHVKVEGPGTIESYLKKKRVPLKTIALYDQQKFPKDFSGIEAVISMGGPMNVYEEDKFLFLKDENVFIKKVLDEEIPFLGVCLGSQLLAKACGARVIKSPVKEVGWFKVRLTREGKADELFKNVDGTFHVYHWHEDMWELPESGTLLAASDSCPHQAFKIGKNAYGVQFHVEVTGEIIADWCDAYFKSKDAEKKKKAKDMIDVYKDKEVSFLKRADVIYDNFMRIIGQRKLLAAR